MKKYLLKTALVLFVITHVTRGFAAEENIYIISKFIQAYKYSNDHIGFQYCIMYSNKKLSCENLGKGVYDLNELKQLSDRTKNKYWLDAISTAVVVGIVATSTAIATPFLTTLSPFLGAFLLNSEVGIAVGPVVLLGGMGALATKEICSNKKCIILAAGAGALVGVAAMVGTGFVASLTVVSATVAMPIIVGRITYKELDLHLKLSENRELSNNLIQMEQMVKNNQFQLTRYQIETILGLLTPVAIPENQNLNQIHLLNN